jgi:Smg protein
MALEDEVDVERVKWVVLLVLVNQPGAEEQAVQVEDMVYYSGDWLH